ncbi:2-C-methyl-D-erythritol 2,4-cyclodiphosphate synthase [Acidilutibacter cellobiosedens]|jgi:2-C-methyl-D-erythritol 2,4-cyclodiphosphate synthase|uniref:2-C-methyl-D-erythritol 2,4-cyclodiphosphate synthase n=2 Tax=Tissierellia TaxID=1737404 RepID=A0A410QFT2_9FIRM|nr:2-C-methyl-D-erythritol 2,4-cyclodiphosphate synthase [Tissierellaceae bacterium]QAT62698.1 2-C-methyl-D-erythritol 2,4-cyclodiphosphate synthase [Acidilutibacter cellobiosedens]SCL89943.1 2-C-methyl-D-erythritol 2,4-cyclodiphosphate synthase [Sporanaerobacter sp. PP17-6a]
MMRIGIGYDAHQLTEERKLILGGVEIPHEKGLKGHSDADVLIHAIMDSMLGALALGDIGKYFPDTDMKYKDISSLILLKRVYNIIKDKGYGIGNMDCIIVAQRPKLASYIDKMKANISHVLNISEDNIGIKATTTEYLGFEGREEGISAYSVCLLIPI